MARATAGFLRCTPTSSGPITCRTSCSFTMLGVQSCNRHHETRETLTRFCCHGPSADACFAFVISPTLSSCKTNGPQGDEGACRTLTMEEAGSSCCVGGEAHADDAVR